MAKSNFVKAAQKNIYKIGKIREYVSEKGKSQGQTKSVRDKTIPADEGDEILIAKGESYYWWQFKNSPKQFSKTAPKQSQLTQSNFLSQLYAIDEKIEEFTCESKEDFDSFKEELVADIEALRDECQDSLDNMPEQLQESSVNNERIENLDSWISDIEGIECDYDEDELRQEVLDENGMDDDTEEKEEGEDDDDDSEKLSEEEIQEKLEEKIQEKVDEAIEELQGTSHNL